MDIEPLEYTENTAFKERKQIITKVNEIIYQCNNFDTDISDKADKTDVYTKSQIDTKLSDKADKSNTYTKSQVDNLIDNIDLDDYYNKSQIDTKLSDKADKTDTYTKTQVDNLIDNIDLDDYYNKTQIDNMLVSKCDISDYYDKATIDLMLSGISTDGVKDITNEINYNFSDKRLTADVKTGDIVFINAVANVRFGTTTYANVNINYVTVLDSVGKKIRAFDIVDVGEPSELKTVFKDVTDTIVSGTPQPDSTRYFDMDVYLIDLSSMLPVGNRVQSITLNTFKVLRGVNNE